MSHRSNHCAEIDCQGPACTCRIKTFDELRVRALKLTEQQIINIHRNITANMKMSDEDRDRTLLNFLISVGFEPDEVSV